MEDYSINDISARERVFLIRLLQGRLYVLKYKHIQHIMFLVLFVIIANFANLMCEPTETRSFLARRRLCEAAVLFALLLKLVIMISQPLLNSNVIKIH